MKIRIARKIRKNLFQMRGLHYSNATVRRVRVRLNETHEAYLHRSRVMEKLTAEIDEVMAGLQTALVMVKLPAMVHNLKTDRTQV